METGSRSQAATPDWIADGVRASVAEVAEYLRTVVAFTAQPGRFATEWASGERRAMNPMGFLAAALGVLAPALVVIGRLEAPSDDSPASLLADAAGAVAPFAYYLLIGSLQHGVLRAFGSRRRLGDSWAMALYAGGGPGTAGTVALCAVGMAVLLSGGKADLDVVHDGITLSGAVLLAAALCVQLVFLVTLALSLRALHSPYGIRGWHVALATMLAIVASALLFGWANPPGKFGIHLVVQVFRTATGRHWHVSLGD
jgi:hypothetical protein